MYMYANSNYTYYIDQLTCDSIAPAFCLVGVMAELAVLELLEELLRFNLGLGYRDLLHKASREISDGIVYLPSPPAIRTLLHDLQQWQRCNDSSFANFVFYV